MKQPTPYVRSQNTATNRNGRSHNGAARLLARRRGALVLEWIVAASIAGIIALGIHGAISIALRSIPDPNGAAATSLQSNRVVDQLATELETAIHVSERSATAITFLVPDRDGDDVAERIRYFWTGTPGGPLTRQYNGGTPVTLAEHVDLFQLTPAFKTVTETYPEICVEDAAASLLVNLEGTTGLSGNNVKSSEWYGQYFTVKLPDGAYAWRTTSVRFIARRSSTFDFSKVQLRPANANLVPTATVLDEVVLPSALVESSFNWVQINFSSGAPLATGAGVCLVVRHYFGSTPITVQSTSAFPGLLKTTNAGSTWSYDGGDCLVAQLFGKQMRADGTRTLSNKYLVSQDIAMRVTATSPTLRTTAAFLNHPELLSNKWELRFDRNPTTVDANADGAADWAVNGGGMFDASSLSNGVWRTSGTKLNTAPVNDFATTTVVDLKFQNTTVGGKGATFAMNALRSGASCAPVLASLAKQTDGTQTLTLSTKTTDMLTTSLLTIPGLPNEPVELRLIIDPESSSVSIRVNEVQQGTYSLASFLSTDGNRTAIVGAEGSNAEFSYVRIRVLED